MNFIKLFISFTHKFKINFYLNDKGRNMCIYTNFLFQILEYFFGFYKLNNN